MLGLHHVPVPPGKLSSKRNWEKKLFLDLHRGWFEALSPKHRSWEENIPGTAAVLQWGVIKGKKQHNDSVNHI